MLAVPAAAETAERYANGSLVVTSQGATCTTPKTSRCGYMLTNPACLHLCCLCCVCTASGGDDLAAHVLPHQLQELVVLAGLDPAASPVLKLLGLLHRRIEERGGRKLFLDDLLDVAAFFRETPLAVLLQLQSQAVAVEAAAVAAELEDAGQQEAVDRDSLEATQQQQRLLGTDAGGSVAEVWREGDVASEDGGPCSGEGSGEGEQWGGGTGEDVFAQHIAMHKPGTAGQVPVECL